MCFNICSLSLFFCKLHVYCHIKSAFYNLFYCQFWMSLSLLPDWAWMLHFCSTLYAERKQNRSPYLRCVLESVFCKADQVVTTEEESEPLPHMQETETWPWHRDKRLPHLARVATFSSRWMVFSPAVVIALETETVFLFPLVSHTVSFPRKASPTWLCLALLSFPPGFSSFVSYGWRTLTGFYLSTKKY